MMKFLVWTVRILLVLLALALAALLGAHWYIENRVLGMPGESHAGPASAPAPELLGKAARLQADVEALAFERNFYQPGSLVRAADYIADEFREAGFEPQRQTYFLSGDEIRAKIARLNSRRPHGHGYGAYAGEGQDFVNLYVLIPGSEDPDTVILVGGHYDSVRGSPGAYDNAVAVAGLLELARKFRDRPPPVTLCLVAFTCEEYPLGGVGSSGSDHFADWLLDPGEVHAIRRPVGVVVMETIGNFSEVEGSQLSPFPLNYYAPSRGNFIAFVGNSDSRDWIRQCIGAFRQRAEIPSLGLATPTGLLDDVMRSDHAPFVARGLPGLMITDTANFRVPNPYHSPEDTPEKIDYIALARVVDGLQHVLAQWPGP